MDTFIYSKSTRPPIRVSSHALERYALRIHPGTLRWLWMKELTYRLAHEGKVLYGAPSWCGSHGKRWYILLDDSTVVPLDPDPNNPEGYVAATVLIRRKSQ